MSGADRPSTRGAPIDRLDLVVPVHNEADTILQTIDAWCDEADRLGVALRVIPCEDGSEDGSAALLREHARPGRIEPLIAPARKGYSKAVVDGIRATDAPYVCCIDGDGQCDPADLEALLARVGSAPVVVGARMPRRDPLPRRLMSASVRGLVSVVHHVDLPDPSCPFVLAEGDVIRALAEPEPELDQGYWWEFHIRREQAGIPVAWVPIRHRPRASGTTQVYRVAKLPRIAATHLAGIVRLRRHRHRGR